MSKRPPEDNPIIAEILRQLSEVMGPKDIDELTKAAMEEALSETFPGLMENTSTSNISVLDGGKDGTDNDLKDLERRSRFQIVEEDVLSADADTLVPDVQVRILSTQDLIEGSDGLIDFSKSLNFEQNQPLRRGQISVEQNQLQVIAVRSEAQGYRVGCDDGAWILETDSTSFEMNRGQSIDIEAQRITVKGLQSSIGWFQIL